MKEHSLYLPADPYLKRMERDTAVKVSLLCHMQLSNLVIVRSKSDQVCWAQGEGQKQYDGEVQKKARQGNPDPWKHRKHAYFL